tara:strand:+ start:114 stop:452 length:339 start_codon:yes stop_codon:yes gene_type:complete
MPSIPDPPDFLEGVALETWHKVSVQLEYMGLLYTVDAPALARYCQATQRWREEDERLVDGEVTTKWLNLCDKLLRLEQQFGMTPSARASLAVDAATAKQRAKDASKGFVTTG